MASVRAAATVCANNTTGSPGSLAWFDSSDPTGTTPLVGDETAANDGEEAGVQLSQNSLTAWLFSSGFDFSAIPDSATINGFKPYFRQRYDNTTGVAAASTQVKMFKAGTAVGNDIGVAGAWPITETEVAYGGATELVGQTWTVAQVKAADFGVGIAITAVATMGTAVTLNHHVELAEIEVFYTEAAEQDSMLTLGVS